MNLSLRTEELTSILKRSMAMEREEKEKEGEGIFSSLWIRDAEAAEVPFLSDKEAETGSVPETENDPFPPVAMAALHPCTSQTNCNDLSARSFSSVLKPSSYFPTLKQNKNSIKSINVGKPIGNEDKIAGVNNNDLALKKLKELHCWAENSLIEDILLATNNDIHEASALLKQMMPRSSTEEIDKAKSNEMGSAIANFPSNANCDICLPSGRTAEHVGQSSKANEREENLKILTDVHENKLFDDHSNMKLILGQLLKNVELCLGRQSSSPKFNPECCKMLGIRNHVFYPLNRSASHHSRAATNAFLRGDHFSAQQHSQNAREEWLAAQRLNAKAAREILSIRNSDNDLWKLDLHGLHAAEAVQALHEHLRRLETRVSGGCSVSPNGVKANNGIVLLWIKLGKPQTSSRQVPASLEVVTGVGNHSRGQAALPTAVRGFLIENGYRFDETRPGLITVRPKFRFSFVV
ncbi:hypothetical protein CXB51_004064 [Gossypium anomalum]|uniref:Smr domain-containing protein n=1 Tax=Gossypium anomalum TaxID=47600 RepID=A0A8J5Z7X1_9ROSI|nr:hypothetical protein CXB51_004064 [Gossypium anomalum]